MSNAELKMFKSIFQMPQQTLLNLLKEYLEHTYEKVLSSKTYLMAIGNIPIALVAHTDTVFKHPPQHIYYDKENEVMWSNEGLGADDRAGVLGILEILAQGYRPTVIFAANEELGCLGAMDLTTDYPKAPTNLKYIIELDRQGINDCVFYDCFNLEFETFVQSYGFELNFGSFSDISELCPAWGIAGCNLSIGYFDEHTKEETFYIHYMQRTIHKVMQMLDEIEEAPYFEYKEFERGPAWLRQEFFPGPTVSCARCGKPDKEINMNPIISASGKKEYYCIDCTVALPQVDFCCLCNEMFMNPGGNNKVCPCCKKN